jgi:hypothetical protein
VKTKKDAAVPSMRASQAGTDENTNKNRKGKGQAARGHGLSDEIGSCVREIAKRRRIT